MRSGAPCSCITFFFVLVHLVAGSLAGDPYVLFDWTVSYLTGSPLGVKQQVIYLLSAKILSVRLNSDMCMKLY